MRHSGTRFLFRAVTLLALALLLLGALVWLLSGRMVDSRFIWAVSLPLAYVIGSVLMRQVPFKPTTAPVRTRR